MVPLELHPEVVFARFRFLDASAQPLLAIAEPLLPPLAGPPAGVALERQPPSLIVVPVKDVAVSVVTAAAQVSTPSTPCAGATSSRDQSVVSDCLFNGSPTNKLRYHDWTIYLIVSFLCFEA